MLNDLFDCCKCEMILYMDRHCYSTAKTLYDVVDESNSRMRESES